MEYQEFEKKVKVIIEGPVRPIPDSAMAKIRKQIDKKSPKSKALFEEAKTCIPGGVEHLLVARDPFPVVVNRALGSKMWDVDGNEYVDHLMGAGAIILGHNYPSLRDEIFKVMQDMDPATVWNSEWELKAIKMLKKHYPSVELFKYFQSGTEANMAAIRMARVYTKKKKIIRFGGSYHGWSDQLTYDIRFPHSGPLQSYGIPDSCYKETISLPPNDLEELDNTFKKYEKEGGVAAVIVEPIGADSGLIPVAPGFNNAIRELCDKYGSLFIFDEVVTGFRLDLGGAQKLFNVKPDITTFGKLLTHGYPSSGGVGGRTDVIRTVSSGFEPGKERAYAIGTLLGNPLSAAATYWTIRFLEETSAIEKAAKTAEKLTEKLNDLFEDVGVPFFAHNMRSIFHFETYCPVHIDIRKPGNMEKAMYRKECTDRIGTALFSRGIIVKNANGGFVSLAHSSEDIEKFLSAFENVLKLVPK